MNITLRDSGETKIVDFEGSLDTNTSLEAEGQLNTLLEQGAQKVLVNLEKDSHLPIPVDFSWFLWLMNTYCEK